MQYDEFLRRKVVLAEQSGFDVTDADIHPMLKPHQRAIVRWACAGGRRAICAAFGLGKTLMQIECVRLTRERAGGMGLIVIPLGVRQEFVRDAAMLGLTVTFIRRIEDAADPSGIYLTNYESIRDEKLDPRLFSVVSLDEASALRGFGGTKTFRQFMALFAGDAKTMDRRTRGTSIRYRFVATATPSPNEYIELLAYSAFLGVMDVSAAKTRFFKRNSEKADSLTIHPHKEREFWLWVASWALFVQRPSDLGFSDDGYSLPPLDVRWHEIPADHADAGMRADGQINLFKEQAIGVVEASREKRASMDVRIAKLMEQVHAALGSRSSARISTRVLPKESGEGAEASRNISGEADPRRAGGVRQGLLQQEQGCAARAPERAGPLELREEQGFVQVEGSARTAQGVWPDGGVPQGDPGVPGVPVPDLHPVSRGVHGAISGPLPRDRSGARNPVPAMQCSSGPLRGKRGDSGASAGVPEHVDCSGDHQIVIWCDLNDEQSAIERALTASGISFSSMYGSQSVDEREALIQRWREGQTTVFLSKPVMYGAGVNLQQAHTMMFAGINFKAQDLLQAIHRIHRFLQVNPCTVDLIYTESEREVRRQLERKWLQHEEMTNTMSELIREYGLSNAAMAESMTRAMGVERVEIRGERHRIVNEDCVRETARMPADSVGLVLTSIPFSTQYEYSPNFADFGHTDTNAHFFAQMDFLTPELLRVLQPGRLAAIHVKDRIVPGGMTGLGFQTVYPFHARCIEHYTRHGFAYMGMKTIVTDVVRENNQTYRLGWTEQCKDGTKMGVGMPEYLLIFRKPPTSTEKSYADLPVVKDKSVYTRARWQVDAHGFARSSGNRLLTPQELEGLPHDVIFKLFRDHSLANVYDFEHDVRIGETLEAKGTLPSDFMLLQPQSWHPDVWSDITRMLTLNVAQSAKGCEMHLCLARGTLVLTRERGYVPIETVQPGEQTLTHKGRWRRVLVARQTGARPTIALRAQGVPSLTLTPDHKVWARVTDWARERDGAERTAPAWVPAEAVLGGYVNFKLPEEEPALDDDRHWWIVGRWLADGHWDARGGAIISCGRHERDALLSALGDHAGAMFDTGTALQVRIIDGKLIRDTLANCGEGAAGKHLPPQAAVLPQKQARALLEGYLSGDGHFLESRSRWQATSTSRALALGVALLVQRVHGTIASVHRGREERDSTIQGRPVRCRQEWVISFDSTTDGRKRPFVLEDGAWKKVRSLTDAGDEEVWCLRVEEDESFTAEGCIVKNCPLQFDIVDRAIAQWSMPGETVFDPFGGLMTVPYRAILQKRFGIGVELSHRYFLDGAAYCAAAEREVSMPSLFDALEPVAA